MRRARKAKLTGRIGGRARRRAAKMLREVESRWGHSPGYGRAWELRDARRLAEAGLVVVGVTKTRLFWPTPEFMLFRTPAAARAWGVPADRIAPLGRSWRS